MTNMSMRLATPNEALSHINLPSYPYEKPPKTQHSKQIKILVIQPSTVESQRKTEYTRTNSIKPLISPIIYII